MSLTKKIAGVATAVAMAFGLAGTAKTSSAQEQHQVVPVPEYHAPISPGQNARDTRIFTPFEGIDTVIDSMYSYEYEDGYFRSPQLPWDDANVRMLWIDQKKGAPLNDPLSIDGYLIQVVDFQGKNNLYDATGAVALIDGPVLNEVGEVVKASPDGIIDYVIRIDEKGWYNKQEERILNHLERGEYHTFNLTENVVNQEGINISRVMQHQYRTGLTTLLAWAETGASVNDKGRIEVDVQVYPRYFDYYFGPNSWCNPFHNYGFHCTSFWGPWIVPPQRWCPTIYRTPRWQIRPPRHSHKPPKPPRDHIRRPSDRRVPDNPTNRRHVISNIKPSATIDDNLRVRRTTPMVITDDIVNRIRQDSRRPAARASGTYNETKPRINPYDLNQKPPARTRPSGTYTPRNNPAPVIRPNTIRRPEYKPSSPNVRSVPRTRSPSTTYKPNSTYKPSVPRTRSAPSTRAPTVRRPSSSRSSAPSASSNSRSSSSSSSRRSTGTVRRAPARAPAASSRSSSSRSSSSRSSAPVRKAPSKPKKK